MIHSVLKQSSTVDINCILAVQMHKKGYEVANDDQCLPLSCIVMLLQGKEMLMECFLLNLPCSIDHHAHLVNDQSYYDKHESGRDSNHILWKDITIV